MSLEAAVRTVGIDVALRQADSVYQLSRQSTSNPDAAKVEKMRLAFSNHPTWVKTSNPTVTEDKHKGSIVYRPYLRFHARAGAKGAQKRGKRLDSRTKAEEGMFEYRLQFEGKKTKETILKVLRGEAEMEALPKK